MVTAATKRFLAGSVWLVTVLGLASASLASDALEKRTVGGDVYISGEDAALTDDTARDAFLAGFSIELEGDVAGDAHVAGFSIETEGIVTGDLYGAGFSVTVGKAVGSDTTLAAYRIKVSEDAGIGGNARLSARHIRVAGPIQGALSAAGDTLTLAAPISGDVVFRGRRIVFEDGARIDGTLDYRAPSPSDIPSDVIDRSQVTYKAMALPRVGPALDAREKEGDSDSDWLAALVGMIIILLFLVGLGAIFLGFAPTLVSTMREATLNRPGTTMLLGGVGLAALIGVIPLAAISVLGLPLVPFAALGLALFWTLGYVLGVYAVSWRIRTAFADQPHSLGGRVVLLAVGLLVLSILNFIPLIGWVLNIGVVFLGLGAMTAQVFGSILRRYSLPSDAPGTQAL